MSSDSDRYWARKVSANPSLANSQTRVTISSVALEKEIRKAFAEGERVGFKKGYQVGKLAKVSDEEKNVLDEMFKQLGEK